jgi:hypothetical protein
MIEPSLKSNNCQKLPKTAVNWAVVDLLGVQFFVVFSINIEISRSSVTEAVTITEEEGGV